MRKINDNKHKREYYTCKRLRMLQYLKEQGFMPYATIPDVKNAKYSCWLFKNTPELEAVIDEYFKNLHNEK